MKKPLSYEEWEARFLEICQLGLEEEPLYPFDDLYDQGLNPGEAFEKYLEKNPDYAEKFQEVREGGASRGATSGAAPTQGLDVLSHKLAEKKRQEEAAAKLSQFCPNCARVMGTKKICKCGYRRKKA